jgi:hypothetical protein
MRRYCSFTIGALVTFSLTSPLSAAPQFGRQRDRGQGQDRVCIFKDAQYQGMEQCFTAGDTVSSLQSLNGQPSSIRIYGRASVTVYDDTNFRGHSTVFTSSVPDLRQVRLDTKTWNDRIQSLQVNSGYGSYGTYGNAPVYGGSQSGQYPTQQLSEGVCVYDRPNYQGRSQCWSGGETLSDLRQQGNWNRRISSIRVFGGTRAVLYRDAGLRGPSFVVNRDIPDLAQVSGQGSRSWDHQISSMQIENGRGYGSQGRFRDRNRNRDRYPDDDGRWR